MTGPHATHEVFNQPSPLAGHDVAQDPALLEALGREGADGVLAELHELGTLAGSEQVQEQARLANECPPRLRTHDRQGHRIDEVEFHPAWRPPRGRSKGQVRTWPGPRSSTCGAALRRATCAPCR